MDEQSAQTRQPSRSQALAGREIGGYRTLHRLGGGGGGEVYLAQRTDDPTALVALKLLHEGAVPDPHARAMLRARFVREAEAVRQVNHPSIVPVLAYGEQDGLLYMALPFLPGGTLAGRIGAFPRGMPLDEVAATLDQIAAALDAAHAHGITHRDVKPSNVLLDDEGGAHLADFGIARMLTTGDGSSPTTLTATGMALGTPHYMAPEQIGGQRVGPAADIYALGVVLYQMVSGALPFTGDTPFAVAMKHVQEAPPALGSQRTDLPPAAEAAILRALAKRPQERFASAGTLAAAFREGLAAPAARPMDSAGAADASTRASGVGMTAAAAVPVALTVGNAATLHDASSSFRVSRIPRAERRAASRGIRWRPSRGFVATLGVVLGVLALVGGAAFAMSTGWPTLGMGQATAPAADDATHAATSTVATGPIIARIPAGPAVYATNAGGVCDRGEGKWTVHGQISSSCASGALVLSVPDCDCALGVVTLATVPAGDYPNDYVMQTTVNVQAGNSSPKFGIKFRQESAQDEGDGRGGYSFMIGGDGAWQFNRYDATGTRTIVSQGHYTPAEFPGAHTLDVVADGAIYAFYVDGTLVDRETDGTYPRGFACLAVEPGATVAFSEIGLYHPQ